MPQWYPGLGADIPCDADPPTSASQGGVVTAWSGGVDGAATGLRVGRRGYRRGMTQRTDISGAEPVDVPAPTVWDWLERRAAAHPDDHAVATHDGSGWSPVRWSQFVDDVWSLASGLVHNDVQPGDRVVVMAPTSYEWTRCDFAIMTAGAVTVPIYDSSSVAQCRSIVEQAAPRFAFVASDNEADVLAEVDPDLPVWRLDDDAATQLADDASEANDTELRNRCASIEGDTVATIVFTSGTTGRSKGVPLTHHQLIWTARQTVHHLQDALKQGESTLLFLPLAHIFARVVVLAALESGVELAFGRSLEDVPEDLRSYQPTFLLAVPRMLDRVISGGRRQATGLRRPVFDWGMRTARAWSEADQPGALLRIRHAAADRIVLRQLRQGLGGRVRYAVSGGARLNPALGHTIRGAGITVLEGYGLTETTAPVTVNTPESNTIGTVGPPLPGVSVCISDEGEVLVKGPNVMTGYLHDAGADPHGADDDSDDDFTDDGWFRTGDQGSVDDHGHLVLHGRTKEVIVTDGGKNVAPTPLEDELVDDPAIAQAMVVGNDRPFIAALVALDEDEAPSSDEQREQRVQEAVDRANRSVSQSESIRKFRIVERQFTEEDEELTPTMKLRRETILEHFSDDIEQLYESSSRNGR
jgi:long-chain acyl-CoA synthetase